MPGLSRPTNNTSPQAAMQALLDDIVIVLRTNRRRHGNCWRKVRLDRLAKCFPLATAADFTLAIELGIEQDLLVAVLVLDKETGCHVAGVKLTRYLTGPRRGTNLGSS